MRLNLLTAAFVALFAFTPILSIMSSQHGAVNAADAELIAARTGAEAPVFTGKWGGQVHASVQLVSEDRLTACYGSDPCYENVVYRIENGMVVVENGDLKWTYTPTEAGFDAAFYNGSDTPASTAALATDG